MADKLTDDSTKHWTGAIQGLTGLAFIDGNAYRFAGPEPTDWPPMQQSSLQVLPTRTIYRFVASGIELTATFLTPLLLDDPDLVSRPASYIELAVVANDGKTHDVALYLDVSAEWVVDNPTQRVIWNKYKLDGPPPLNVLRLGSEEQPVLAKDGDDLRIDWGYLHLVFEDTSTNSGVITSQRKARAQFERTRTLSGPDDTRLPRAVADERPVMACSLHLGTVGAKPVARMVLLVYDDLYSIEYFHRKLRPYWRRTGLDANGLIALAFAEYPILRKRCERFDRELLADAHRLGGGDYADIVSLAYRQAIAAHKLVADATGRPLLFSKENFSGACMATVDVTYPSSPIFLLFNPSLLRALMEPILEYATCRLWPNDFAPHDIGRYPRANGQFYGGGPSNLEMQMPVEECGNMLIMMAAIARREGNASFAARHWKVLTKWASYLRKNGLDPGNQLCTDDFAGHLAHNANLSIKAVIALACYAELARALGHDRISAEYRAAAEEMASRWKAMADDGDHYRLAFDRPGTWSMKYNLVWDSVLGLKLFDPLIARKEVGGYTGRLNRYGLPLDSRATYTKADWLVWVAALADSDSRFHSLVAPLRRFLHESPDRVPFSDWYDTTDGKVVGFRARSVVGGVFIRMLQHEPTWRKWSRRAKSLG